MSVGSLVDRCNDFACYWSFLFRLSKTVVERVMLDKIIFAFGFLSVLLLCRFRCSDELFFLSPSLAALVLFA